ncbi:MAG: hypothetical protein Fur0022_15710 [Anaerolineales bacterium]
MYGPEAWLIYAQEDLRGATSAMKEKINNQVCFHAQQCVEKLLKAALLVHQGQTPPKTHRLVALLELIGKQDFNDFARGLDFLDQVYIPSRYPDIHPGALPEGPTTPRPRKPSKPPVKYSPW